MGHVLAQLALCYLGPVDAVVCDTPAMLQPLPMDMDVLPKSKWGEGGKVCVSSVQC